MSLVDWLARKSGLDIRSAEIQLRRRSGPRIYFCAQACRSLGQQYLRILLCWLRNATGCARRQSGQRTRQPRSPGQLRQTLPQRPGRALRNRR